MFKLLAQEYVSQYSVLNLFNFITFRVGAAILTSLFFSLIFGEFIIDKLSKIQPNGQPIRNDGPQTHIIKKAGTPTMGGVLIILSVFFSSILWSDLQNNFVIKEITQHEFDNVILSGDLFKKALEMFPNFRKKFIYKRSSKSIMTYLVKNLHKKAMIMAKCSNATEVNKFVKLLKSKKKDKIV